MIRAGDGPRPWQAGPRCWTMAHNIRLWRLRNLASRLRQHAHRPRRVRCHANRCATSLRRPRRPYRALDLLLANPEDACHPGDVALREAAAGRAAADRFEFDLLTGLTHQLFGDHVAVARLHDDAIAAMGFRVGRHDHDVAGAIGRGQAVAADLERESVRVADAGRIDLVPALADGMPGVIKEAAPARLGVLCERQRMGHRHAAALADERQEATQRFAGGGQAFGDALRARPARLAGRALALALVEGGGVEAG